VCFELNFDSLKRAPVVAQVHAWDRTLRSRHARQAEPAPPLICWASNLNKCGKWPPGAVPVRYCKEDQFHRLACWLLVEIMSCRPLAGTRLDATCAPAAPRLEHPRDFKRLAEPSGTVKKLLGNGGSRNMRRFSRAQSVTCGDRRWM